jgi:uncharacterized protein
MQRKALILAGGWPGHQPDDIAQIFSTELSARGCDVCIEKSLEIFADPTLSTYDLIFPCWTMGTLTDPQSKGLQAAIRAGSGLGGIHGGMGDAFRGNLEYEWMVGGHFVGHPHVGDYTVRRTATEHAITAGMPAEFPYHSEQYYMMVDPAIQVLAETTYTYEGHPCTMPVVWTRQWGRGRVFYSALGHSPKEFTDHPHVREMTVRGLLWAARHSST